MQAHAQQTAEILVQETAHATAAHSGAHELPNWITLLYQRAPEIPLVQFLHHWENLVFSILIATFITWVAVRSAKRLALIPTPFQNFFEIFVEGIDAFVTGVLGPKGRQHVPFLGTLFIYILLMNWSGLIPLSKSPTAAWSITLALALITMVYVQATGIREQGFFHYLKHLAGNPVNIFGIILVPLMFTINLLLEFGAVPFSLSLRLFSNISSEDRLLYNFAEMITATPFIFPFQIFANILSIVFSLVQAFVFMLLSTVYISLMMPHDDEHHESESHENHSHNVNSLKSQTA